MWEIRSMLQRRLPPRHFPRKGPSLRGVWLGRIGLPVMALRHSTFANDIRNLRAWAVSCIPARGRRVRVPGLYGKSLRSLLGLQLKCDTRRLVFLGLASGGRMTQFRSLCQGRWLHLIWNSSSKQVKMCREESNLPRFYCHSVITSPTAQASEKLPVHCDPQPRPPVLLIHANVANQNQNQEPCP